MTSARPVLDQLLAQPGAWLDSATAGRRIDPYAVDEKASASAARREGRVFAHWDGQHFRYPAFQFEAAAGPRAATKQLVDVLPRDRDGSVGTDAILWVFAPDDALDGKTPADVFPDDPERVIALARTRRDGGSD